MFRNQLRTHKNANSITLNQNRATTNNNNSNDSDNNSDAASLFDFSDPKLADIVQKELPYLLRQEFDEVHELCSRTQQPAIKREAELEYPEGKLLTISDLSLQTPHRDPENRMVRDN